MPDTPIVAHDPAVAGSGVDAAVPAHYGDPFTEQRTLAERVGVVDRSHRELITVTGSDRLSWLHTLTTQHVTTLKPGTGTEALILTPQGRIGHHALLTDDGTTTWLDTEPGAAAGLLAYLSRMRFLLRVDPQEVTTDWAMLSVLGPLAAQLLGSVDLLPQVSDDLPSGTTVWPVTPLPGGGWLRRVPWPTADSFDLLVPRSQLAAVRDRLHAAGGVPCGMQAYEALRVAARRPRLGTETDDRTMPHELGWVSSAVALDKGCYPGQETVAKLHNMGQAPRRMVLLSFDGSSDQLPASGEPVRSQGREIGAIGTAVRHYELGTVALALVKRGTADDAVVEIGVGADEVRAVIDTDGEAGATTAPPVPGGGQAGAGRRAVAEFTARRRAANHAQVAASED